MSDESPEQGPLIPEREVERRVQELRDRAIQAAREHFDETLGEVAERIAAADTEEEAARIWRESLAPLMDELELMEAEAKDQLRRDFPDQEGP